jgi:Fe-S oxidoreductase
MDRNRLIALLRLAVTFWVHLFRRLFVRREAALPQFRANYRGDGIFPVGPEERAAMPALGECVACRLCDTACPPLHAEAETGFVGPSRLVLANSRYAPAVATWVDPFLCIRCRACDDACPQGVAIDGLVGSMRGATFREATEAVPLELRAACERVARGERPVLGPDGAPQPIAELPAPQGDARADYVLLASCAAGATDQAVEAAVLARAGISFAPGPAICCGAFERSCGAPGAAARTGALLAALAARGTFQVATADPRCYAFLRTDPRCRREVQVTHLLELARDLRAAAGAGEPEDAPRVTYHDPCEAGPVPGAADLAREAIRRAGAELVEMPRARGEASCCGMGGGTWTFAPALAEELGRARVREAKATGAALLLTQSGLCRDHLRRCAALEGGGIEVKNVIDFIAERAGVAVPRAPAAPIAPAREEPAPTPAPPPDVGASAAREAEHRG